VALAGTQATNAIAAPIAQKKRRLIDMADLIR
jgi:hypothetical protein